MSFFNVQVRLDKEIANKIDKLSTKSRSAFVRQAIREKIQRELEQQKETQWISALQKNLEKDTGNNDWLESEAWEEV